MRYMRSGLFLVLSAVLVIVPLGSVLGADDRPTMQHLWIELEKGEMEATRALLTMSSRPDEAVAFLKTVMRPLKIEPQAAAMDLIVKLESNDDAIWRPAFEELEYFDPRLAFKLDELFADINLTPARQRLVEVLSGRKPGSLGIKEVKLKWLQDQFIFSLEPGNWGAAHTVDKVGTSEWWGMKKKWTRAVRAIMLLEHIGTPEALAVIERMTTGHPDAFPTKAAKESARNLAAKVR